MKKLKWVKKEKGNVARCLSSSNSCTLDLKPSKPPML